MCSEFRRTCGTNAQETYDFTRSRLKERNKWAAQANEGRLKQFPITEIEKRGWIERYRDKADKVGALLAFLGFASLDAWDNHGMEPVTEFRISENSRVSRGALSAWLRRGEIEGRDMDTAAYDEREFKRVVKEIRSLTATTPEVFQPRMVDLCANAGVAVVFVQELPKSAANGVARWITPDKGLIQMSLNGNGATSFGSASSMSATIFSDTKEPMYISKELTAPPNMRMRLTSSPQTF